MPAPLVIAIIVQTICVAALLLHVRKNWISSAGFVFGVTAWVYHGGSEIANWLYPGRNSYRTSIPSEQVETAALWSAAVVASFCAAYLLSRPYRAFNRARTDNRIPTVLDDWRLMLIVALPMYVFALSPLESRYALGYWAPGMTDQFILMAVVLMSLAVTKHASPGSVVAVLCFQGALLAFLANRAAVGVSLAMYLSARLKTEPKQKYKVVLMVGAIFVATSVVISSARAVAGREEITDRPANRAAGIRAGIQALSQPAEAIDATLADSVYRLDGNSFTALIVGGIENGIPPLGWELIYDAVQLAVPSFLFSTKMDLPPEARNEKALIIVHFGLPRQIDYVPTLVSMLIASFGLIGAAAAGALIGAGYAYADRYLLRSSGPFALIAGLGLMQSTLQMELGVVEYFVALRGLIVIAGAVYICDRWRASARRTLQRNVVGGDSPLQRRRMGVTNHEPHL